LAMVAYSPSRLASDMACTSARSAEDVHAMSLANLDGEYATIAKTQEVLDGL